MVWHLRLGKSTDEICAEYDLGLAEVHAALAYYYDHQGEIDQSLTARDEYVDGLRSAGSPTLGGVPGD